ncbi:hypothetical protein ACRRTK_024568 [Alexandromys fortis]
MGSQRFCPNPPFSVTLILIIIRSYPPPPGAEEVAQLVECLSAMHIAMGSVPNILETGDAWNSSTWEVEAGESTTLI